MAVRWRGRGGKPELQLVAGVHDHVAVVDAAEQLAHVAETGVITDQVAPLLRDIRQPIVLRQLEAPGAFERRAGESPVPQLRGLRNQPRRVQHGRAGAGRVAEPVPVDLQVGAEPQTRIGAGPEGRAEIHHDRLVLAGRKPQIGVYDHPLAGRIPDLEGQSLRRRMTTLTDRDVDAAVGWIDPPVCDQPDRLILSPGPLAELELHEMVPRDALVGAPLERREVPAILLAHDRRDVQPRIVPRAGDRPGGFRRMRRQHRDLPGKALIHEDLQVFGMVDDQQ